MENSNRYDMIVVGMRVERCIRESPTDEIFETEPCENERYILFCIAKLYNGWRRRFTITLWEDGGWCSSGYTTATFGYMKVKEVEDEGGAFGPFTHMPKDGSSIKLEGAYFDPHEGVCFEKTVREYDDGTYDDSDISNNVFTYSSDGSDEYYPSGYITVNMDLFKESTRAFEKRPVWIFAGDSATGKSSLAYYLRTNKKVYETDSAPDGKLPETIWADVIVVGNKYKFTVADVASHLPKEDTEVVTVNFFKGYENE